MGLSMAQKQAVTNQVARRYRKANKREKKRILDEYCATTGYHRKYAMQLLNRWGRSELHRIDGTLVKIVVGKPRKRAKRVYQRIYDEPVHKALRLVWDLFDYQCGKRLVPLLRANMPVLRAQPELDIGEEVAGKLLQISPATVDRILKADRVKLQIKGRSHTRHGPMLKHQIPIRTEFRWDERKPGFFELDTVHHEGTLSSGEYCCTLNATDVSCGWVELRAVRNRAHRWVKEAVSEIRAELPFQMFGIDSDNGSEFINHDLLAWCKQHDIQFTRGRPYRKNDNCFVEQKNDLAVRRTVGYYRFDTDAEYEALQDVYRALCPLLNYFYASMKLVEKVRTGAKVKKVYDEPKPPYQRLMESDDVPAEVKATLRKRASRLHIVKQKRLVDVAVSKLMRLYEQKKQQSLEL
jgi:hypothetical protein